MNLPQEKLEELLVKCAEIKKLANELFRRLELATKNAKRYEVVRKMNIMDFSKAYRLNIETGKPFDDIIDDWEPIKKGAGK